MYATRNSARLQQEKEAEHNNQLLSFFNGKIVYSFNAYCFDNIFYYIIFLLIFIIILIFLFLFLFLFYLFIFFYVHVNENYLNVKILFK